MKPYSQTTKFTSAAASLMTVINHFNPDFLLTRDNEMDLWQKTVTLPTRGSNIFALAIVAHDNNIPVKVIVEDPEYKFPLYRFKGYKKKETEIAAFVSEIFKKKAEEKGIKIEERNFKIKEIKDLLTKNKKVILLRLVAGVLRNSKFNKTTTHYFPVFGYEKGHFLVMDSKEGPVRIAEKRFLESFEAVKLKCKKDNRMLVFG